MVDSAAELAYEEVADAIEQQRLTLDELRTRTGSLLAAASIATSFLGAAALEGGSVGWWSKGALAAFVLCLTLSVLVLWPSGNWLFHRSANSILSTYRDLPDPRAFEALALALEGDHSKNRLRIDRRFQTFAAAAAVLGAETLLWSIDLATGGG